MHLLLLVLAISILWVDLDIYSLYGVKGVLDIPHEVLITTLQHLLLVTHGYLQVLK